ncbi:MAG: hypothetical protein IMF12_00495 [Proteobacteria bacterium]|nr:hypothetical protein [Pseudomonadota bacterium]
MNNNFNLFEFYQIMEDKDVILSFKGDISQDILVSVGDLLKDKLSNEDAKLSVTKKVFFVFIELAQNIYRYSSETAVLDKKKVGAGMVAIRESNTHFMILAGNNIKKSDMQSLIEQCQNVNQMSPDELKLAYKNRMKTPREGDKIGAGAGLISIVRKAGNQIQFTTTSIDADYAFLVLSVQVNKDG